MTEFDDSRRYAPKMDDKPAFDAPGAEDQFLVNRPMQAEARASQQPPLIQEPSEQQAPPEKDWSRGLTSRGIGGWFKRLFSSKARAAHKREIQERRDAWKDTTANILAPGFRPNLSLLRSSWAGSKISAMQRSVSQARAFSDSPRVLAKSRADQGTVNRLNELRSPQELSEEARAFASEDARADARLGTRGAIGADMSVDAGEDSQKDKWGNLAKSTQRPAPVKGILKSNAVAPALPERPPGTDRRLDDAVVASNENEDAAYTGMTEAKSAAGAAFADVDVKAGYNRLRQKVKKVVGLPDTNSDPASEDQGDAATASARGIVEASASEYGKALDRSEGLDKRGKRRDAKRINEDQGDLVSPASRFYAPEEKGRSAAFAFHTGFWNREIEQPEPTRVAKGGKRVGFASGGNAWEPLLNRPGKYSDPEGEGDGERILPTGASVYGAHNAYWPEGKPLSDASPERTEFNRLMAARPDVLPKALEDAEYGGWARGLVGTRYRDSMSARSRANPSLPEAKRTALEREGAEFHEKQATSRSSPQRSPSQPQSDDAGSESGNDMDSNQANVSDDGETSMRRDENLD